MRGSDRWGRYEYEEEVRKLGMGDWYISIEGVASQRHTRVNTEKEEDLSVEKTARSDIKTNCNGTIFIR